MIFHTSEYGATPDLSLDKNFSRTNLASFKVTYQVPYLPVTSALRRPFGFMHSFGPGVLAT
jgi:hypothetical protein